VCRRVLPQLCARPPSLCKIVARRRRCLSRCEDTGWIFALATARSWGYEQKSKTRGRPCSQVETGTGFGTNVQGPDLSDFGGTFLLWASLGRLTQDEFSNSSIPGGELENSPYADRDTRIVSWSAHFRFSNSETLPAPRRGCLLGFGRAGAELVSKLLVFQNQPPSRSPPSQLSKSVAFGRRRDTKRRTTSGSAHFNTYRPNVKIKNGPAGGSRPRRPGGRGASIEAQCFVAFCRFHAVAEPIVICSMSFASAIAPPGLLRTRRRIVVWITAFQTAPPF
jgi:hypothetical protein